MMDTVELREAFLDQARWREQKAVQYPEDTRNAKAAELLRQLAEVAKDVPENVFLAYEEAFQAILSSKTWEDGMMEALEEWNQMMREIGFHAEYDDAEEFLRTYIERCLLIVLRGQKA
jgi:hypothetical protein